MTLKEEIAYWDDRKMRSEYCDSWAQCRVEREKAEKQLKILKKSQ